MRLGYIRRNMLLAQSVLEAYPNADVLLLSGVRESGAFKLPKGADSVKIPTYFKTKDGAYIPRSLGKDIKRLVNIRKEIISASLRAFEPDIVVIDNVPRSAMNELDNILPELASRGTHIVLGLRDIIDEPEAVKKQWQKLKNVEIIRLYFLRVWKLFPKAFAELPNFAEKLAVAKGNIHEVAQSISIAFEIKKLGIQHLHAHFGTQATTVARQAAIFADISYSFTAHAKDIYYQYEESTELGEKMRDAFSTVTVSDYNLAYLQQQYGADAAKAVRVYNGMDLDKFPYAEFTSRERHILAVGRLVEKKGFSVLLDVLALLKQQNINVKCTLVGDGTLRQELAAQIKALNIEDVISMVGPMPQPDIIEMMKAANMVVTPCVISEDGDRDGLPTVLLESMALGTPVSSTQVEGIPELVIDNETGLCVPPQDPMVLAQAMQRLLDDQALCQQL